MGIDEAGKGPVIGPLVICGYLIEEKDMPLLETIKVRDSKIITDAKRREMVEKLKNTSNDYLIKKVFPGDIDKRSVSRNLNALELEQIRELIDLLEPDKVIVDAFEFNTERFKEKLSSLLKTKTDLIAENYADQTYPIVSAASILAKVERDDEIEKIKKQCGYDFGTGYPSDPRTIEFLVSCYKKNKCFPKFVRGTWLTAKEIRKTLSQCSLFDIKSSLK